MPELQFHSHDRLKLSIALIAGLTVAVLIKHFEADADEPTPTPASVESANLMATRSFSPGFDSRLTRRANPIDFHLK